MVKERIAKIIAQRSALSRRQAEKAISDGRVHVNHDLLTTPAYNASPSDHILLDHEPLKEIKPILVLYHKPVGLVCSHNPQKGQKSIYTQLRDVHSPPDTFLRHIGRLDINSEGLLLLTNCPKTATEIQRKPWKKTYKVRTQGIITNQNLQTLTHIQRIDGIPITPMDIKLLRTTTSNSWSEWTLTEGRYRQIRVALEKIRSRASRIIRTQYGPFTLPDIPPGHYHVMTTKVLQSALCSS